MSFTFSDKNTVDYLEIGACNVCGVRLTRGCEHINTQAAQEWLAAHIVAEQGNDIDEDALIETVRMAELLDRHPADAAQQIEREIDGILRTDSDNYLPHTNTNGNLQWQGVEFDMPAIVELTQAYSAELKAQIDARAEAVRLLNVQSVNNVRLGVKR